MTKAASQAKAPPKRVETITLKVFIHCEGCRRKVRRIIRVLDGVEDVTVDPTTGKVTVTGNVDAKAILQRLQKYGKQAEMWPSSAPNPAPPAPAVPTGKPGTNQPKPHSNNHSSESSSKKKGNAGADGGGKGGSDKAAVPAAESESKKGTVGNGSKPKNGEEGKPEEDQNPSSQKQSGGGDGGGGGAGGGGSGKKGGKKGGPDITAMDPPHSSIQVAANRSLAPYDSVQTGYAYQSAEYATHMFSDENANNCIIM